MAKFTILAAAAMVPALLWSNPAAAQNLLTNGGFEAAPRADIGFRPTSAAPAGEVQDYWGSRITNEQYLASWIISTPYQSNIIRGSYGYNLAPGYAAQGDQFLHLNWSPLGGIVLDNTISQSFTLGSGMTGVAFSAFMSTEAGYDGSTLTAYILDGSNGIVAQSMAMTHTAGNRMWALQSWDTALAPGTYTFSLRGVGSGNAWDVLIDDVQLTGIAGAPGVPEPATWLTLILGLGTVGAAMRARRALGLRHA